METPTYEVVVSTLRASPVGKTAERLWTTYVECHLKNLQMCSACRRTQADILKALEEAYAAGLESSEEKK